MCLLRVIILIIFREHLMEVLYKNNSDLYKHVPFYEFYIYLVTIIESRNQIPSNKLLKYINNNIQVYY